MQMSQNGYGSAQTPLEYFGAYEYSKAVGSLHLAKIQFFQNDYK